MQEKDISLYNSSEILQDPTPETLEGGGLSILLAGTKLIQPSSKNRTTKCVVEPTRASILFNSLLQELFHVLIVPSSSCTDLLASRHRGYSTTAGLLTANWLPSNTVQRTRAQNGEI